eukprot:scaffold9735_cov348-Ochromonas_danica.AAC.1
MVEMRSLSAFRGQATRQIPGEMPSVGIAYESMKNEGLIQFFSYYPEMEEIRLDQLTYLTT